MGRVKSATLVEVIIAAIIIVALFIIVNMVFMNLTGNTVSVSKVKAREMINTYAIKAGDAAAFTDISTQDGGLIIEQKVIEIINKNAAILAFTVFDNTGKILEWQERIILIN